MPIRTFHLTGTVVAQSTGKGAPGLRVEAWDKDARQHTVFGSAVTDDSGAFTIPADVDLPGGASGDLPAFIKVFSGDQEAAVTGNVRVPNILTWDRPISLRADVSTPEPSEEDKIGFDQVVSVVDFVRLSDFRGLVQEGKDRLRAGRGIVTDVLKSSASKIQLTPLKPPATRGSDIISQDPATATRRLADNQVTVTRVSPYTRDISGLTTIGSLGSSVKKGDHVELFQENGVVKAYRIIKPAKPTIDPASIDRLNGDVTSLRADLQDRDRQIADLSKQLEAAKADSSKKDAAIAGLSNDLKAIKTDQDKLVNERIKKIEDALHLSHP